MKRWLTGVAIFAGAALRLVRYFSNRSLWFDEAALAVNIIERPLTSLLKPLEFHQGAPIGFLIFEKLASLILGPGELALRLFPLLCGLATLFAFAAVARFYVSNAAIPLAIALLAINPSLIYFSSEAKQYSSDALVSVMLLWMFAVMTKSDFEGKKVFIYACIGAAAVWFSHPAIFLLAGAAVALIVSTRADKSRIPRLAFVLSSWAASFLILYFVSLRHLQNDATLTGFWSQYFPPSLTSRHTLGWLFDAFLTLFRDPAGLAILPGMAFFLAGFFTLFRRKRTLNLALAGSTLATVATTFAHRYPLGSRLLVFAIPIILLMVAEGVAAVCLRLPQGKLIYIAAGCVVLYQPLVNTVREITTDRRDDIRPVLKHIQANSRSSDAWYVYFQARPQMRYYSNLLQLHVNWKLGSDCGGDAACYARDVDSLSGSSRTWIVLSHVMVRDGINDGAILVEQLDKEGRRLQEFSTPSARAYLYDLSAPEKDH